MGLAKRVAYNTIIQFLGKITTAGLSLAVVALLTRYLGVSGYGEYTTAFAFVSFFAVFADFGINIIIVREISKDEKLAPGIIANVLGLRILFSLSILLLAPLIALFLPYSRLVKIAILIFSFALYFLSLNQIFVGIFQSRLKLDRAVFTEVVGRVIILLATLVFIKLKLSFVWIISAVFWGNLVNLGLSWLLANKIFKIGLSFNLGFWKKIFLESLSMGLVLVLGMLFHRIDTIMLSLLKESYDVGIYGAAYKIFDFLVVIPGLFVGTVFPLFSQFFVTSPERFKAVFQKSFDVLSIVGLPLALGGVMLSPYIINLVAGNGYEPAISVFQVLSIALLLIFFTQLSGTTLVAIGKQSKLILPYIICVVFNFLANFFLISSYSYLGAAWTVLLTEILVFVFGYYLTFQEARLFPRLLTFWKSILSSLFMGIFLWLFLKFRVFVNWDKFDSYSGPIRLVSFFSLIIFAGAFYLLVLYLFRGYSKTTILSLIKKEEQ